MSRIKPERHQQCLERMSLRRELLLIQQFGEGSKSQNRLVYDFRVNTRRKNKKKGRQCTKETVIIGELIGAYCLLCVTVRLTDGLH